MKDLCRTCGKTCCDALACPPLVLGGVALFSFVALAMALASEAFLGLEPCILCEYQRAPYALVIVLGLLGLALRHKAKVTRSLTLLCALAFLVNSGIAFYHSGVELHWWTSIVEGCAANFDFSEPKSVLENILSAPAARCDQIPWADPVFGLSMANYNVLACFGLFVFCALSFLRQSRAKAPQ